MIDARLLASLMGDSVPLSRYEALLPAFVGALAACECNTPQRVAMFCAQVGTESWGLRFMEELASGSAYEGRRDLGNTVAGDGVRFKGRGPIQVTGRYNYGQVSQYAYSLGLVSSPTFFVDNPRLLASDRYGFVGVVWFWTRARSMNVFADRGDVLGATRAVNGGTNGLADRQARYARCLSLLEGSVTASQDLNGFLSVRDVKLLQERIGVVPDGVFGPKSVSALTVKAGYEPDSVLDLPSKTVMTVQKYLNQFVGWSHYLAPELAVDGVLGWRTACALGHYLRDCNGALVGLERTML